MECLAVQTGAFKSCSIVEYTTDCVLFVLIDPFSRFFSGGSSPSRISAQTSITPDTRTT